VSPTFSFPLKVVVVSHIAYAKTDIFLCRLL
jgi:hypothetical protein